jgi:hypothetical protein
MSRAADAVCEDVAPAPASATALFHEVKCACVQTVVALWRKVAILCTGPRGEMPRLAHARPRLSRLNTLDSPTGDAS